MTGKLGIGCCGSWCCFEGSDILEDGGFSDIRTRCALSTLEARKSKDIEKKARYGQIDWFLGGSCEVEALVGRLASDGALHRVVFALVRQHFI